MDGPVENLSAAELELQMESRYRIADLSVPRRKGVRPSGRPYLTGRLHVCGSNLRGFMQSSTEGLANGARLVLEVYRRTSSYPEGERFGLISQLRRLGLRADEHREGSKRQTSHVYARFLNIAEGRWRRSSTCSC